MITRIKNLLFEFDDIFKDNKNDFFVYFAPGRINLIGEHTDYTGGLVFPTGIDRGTYFITKKNNLSKIRITSVNFDKKIEEINLNMPLIKENKWTDYVKGILNELKKIKNDIKQGFDCLVFGNIPNGAGLSSSASFEMVSIIAFLDLNNFKIPLPGTKSMVDYTLLAQKAENNFVGVNCGIMDQFIVGNAKKDTAIKLDCYNLNFEYTNIDFGDHILLIANTNKQRKLNESKYNERRSECEEGFKLLKSYGCNKDVLGKISIKEWELFRNRFNNNRIIKKRLNHVITENERVSQAFISLKNKNMQNFAQLLNESGDSLKNDYEVTGFHLDSLVDSARSTDGVIASRMTGGGFGGCTVNLIENKNKDKIIKEIEKKYTALTNIKPEFYIFNIGDGACKINF